MNQSLPSPLFGDPPLPVLRATVTLGTLSKKCKGMGICSLTLEPGSGKPEAVLGYAVRIQLTGEKRLRFTFRKEALDTQAKATFFTTACFRMEEDFPLPEELCSRLQPVHTVIRAGEYPIVETASVLIIDF
jgi:hypothetical protein